MNLWLFFLHEGKTFSNKKIYRTPKKAGPIGTALPNGVVMPCGHLTKASWVKVGSTVGLLSHHPKIQKKYTYRLECRDVYICIYIYIQYMFTYLCLEIVCT